MQANPGVNINVLRPYKGYAAIQEEESVVNSQYNGLQVTWNRRFTAGSMFGVHYTYSKSEDNGSNYRDIVPDTYNTSNLWGPSEYDTRHIAIINYLYELPFFKDQTRMSGKVLGGWQISGAVQAQTGTPCGIGTNKTLPESAQPISAVSDADRKDSSGCSTELRASLAALPDRLATLIR